MSARTERLGRRGIALLIAVVICAVVGVCVLALWRGSMGAARAATLESSIARADALADSALVRAIVAVDGGAWRGLELPGQMMLAGADARVTARWRADVGRVGWGTLVLRGVADTRSGARGVMSHAERRSIVPLRAPFAVPDSPLTGAVPWSIDAAATIDVPLAIGAEAVCRPAGAIVVEARHPFPLAVDSLRLPLIDPDTLRDSLVGAVRLTGGRVTHPLRFTGMVVVDTELVVEADLRVTGMLVVRGSVHPAGGRLDVTGAVMSGDTNGRTSGLGAGDRVRYDACAIRRAVARVTSLSPTRTWTTLTVF